MKFDIRLPYFEIGVKNYLFGDDVLKLARAADAAAKEFDVDVMFIAPYTDIRRVAEQTERLIVLAPYMDLIPPGRGMADVLPEALRAAGAKGVVINHCERPMTLSAIRKTIDRAREIGILSFVCTDTISETQAVAHFHPDVMNPEPSELIGRSSEGRDLGFIRISNEAVAAIDPEIVVEQAAGISSPQQVYDCLAAGAQAVGAASGICRAEDPCEMAREMIASVRRFIDENREKG